MTATMLLVKLLLSWDSSQTVVVIKLRRSMTAMMLLVKLRRSNAFLNFECISKIYAHMRISVEIHDFRAAPVF